MGEADNLSHADKLNSPDTTNESESGKDNDLKAQLIAPFLEGNPSSGKSVAADSIFSDSPTKNRLAVGADDARAQQIALAFNETNLGSEYIESEPVLDDRFQIDPRTLRSDSPVYGDNMRPEIHAGNARKPYVYNPANPPGLAVNPPASMQIIRDRIDEQDPFDINHRSDKRKCVGCIPNDIHLPTEKGNLTKHVNTLGYKGKTSGWETGADGIERSKSFDFVAQESFDPQSGDLIARKVVYLSKSGNGPGPNIRFKDGGDAVGTNVQSVNIAVQRDGTFKVEIEQFQQQFRNPTTGATEKAVQYWSVLVNPDGTIKPQKDPRTGKDVNYVSLSR